MIKASFVFVPPGGGEADYHLDFEVPAIPQSGDYISITRPGEQGSEDFIVRRSWWNLKYPDSNLYKNSADATHGHLTDVVFECEFAKGPYSSESHKKEVAAYQARHGNVKTFDNTAY